LRVADVARSYVYARRQHDEAFAEAFERARRCGRELLIDENYERAVWGSEREIYYKGEVVGRERKTHDTLAMFFIKQADPSYRGPLEGANEGTFAFHVQLHPDAAKASESGQ
jgi:hypothetical protein